MTGVDVASRNSAKLLARGKQVIVRRFLRDAVFDGVVTHIAALGNPLDYRGLSWSEIVRLPDLADRRSPTTRGALRFCDYQDLRTALAYNVADLGQK